MKNRWNTQYDSHDCPGETNPYPSQTIPNEAMSIREIMIRYSRGLPIDGKVPIFDEENDLPDPRKLDLAEIQQLREEYEAELKQIKETQAKTEEARKKAQNDEKEQYKKFREFMEAQARQGDGGPAESPRPTGLKIAP